MIVTPLYDAAGTRDISDRKAAEQEIETLAFSDSLTGLPNRRLLLGRMRQAIAASVRHAHQGYLYGRPAPIEEVEAIAAQR